MKFCCSVTGRVLAAFSVAAACALVCGCSSAGYPTVLSDPPGPNDTTLSPDEVKKAMDNLISDRNRQCSEAIAEKAPGDPPPDCGVATGATPSAGAATKP